MSSAIQEYNQTEAALAELASRYGGTVFEVRTPDGMVAARKMMNLSSSFDHRVVDGMNAAKFIQRIKRYLECPGTLLL